MTRNRKSKYTNEDKLAALEAIKNGEDVEVLAANMGVKTNVIYTWASRLNIDIIKNEVIEDNPEAVLVIAENKDLSSMVNEVRKKIANKNMAFIDPASDARITIVDRIRALAPNATMKDLPKLIEALKVIDESIDRANGKPGKEAEDSSGNKVTFFGDAANSLINHIK